MTQMLLLAGLLVAALTIPFAWKGLRERRRLRTMVRLLDLADALEALLDRSQARMTALHAVVGRVPADIAETARASLDIPVRDAKRDVLQHRLWLQQHGPTALQAELDTACEALERARDRLAAELDELDRAGHELAVATEASAEAARREPPSLRRDPGAP